MNRRTNSDRSSPVEIAFRIPGNWPHPQELVDRLPDGCRLTSDHLILPDGAQVEVHALPTDDQFQEIFKTSCRRPPTTDELAVVDSYRANIGLTGPGGSLTNAMTMMRAGAVIIAAGGGGLFIDNSGVAHGGEGWTELTEDAGVDALTFAYVNIVRGKQDVWTVGMHVLGFPDIVMRRLDLDIDGDTIIETMRYLCTSDKPIGDGHILADLNGPRFQTSVEACEKFAPPSPMHNPFGRLRLVSVKEFAERN